jgi:dihydrofolate reductase
MGKLVVCTNLTLDKNILTLGSGALVRTLMRENVIDEWVLLIHPLVLGRGRRLFTENGPYFALSLANCATTPTGVLVATYRSPLSAT